MTGIDRANRQVETDEGRIGYDWLVVATGARHAYFGHDEWEPYAPGLKRIDDATALRRQILMAFEKAENAAADMMRQRQLTFVVVGGGPTGVELAGAIAELAKTALPRDFRNIDPREARIVLIEAGERLLAAFPAVLSAHAKRALEKLGVEVRLAARVTDCSARGVVVDGLEGIESECVIWAAGVAASPAAKWLGAEKDRAGRVKVNPDLTLPDHPEIFVIGDTATVAGAGWQAGARRGAGRQAAGRLRRRRAAPPGPGRRGGCRGAAPLPLPQFRHAGYHRPGIGGRRFRLDPDERLSRLAALGHDPRVLPGRLSQSARRPYGVALGLCQLPPWRPTHHRLR